MYNLIDRLIDNDVQQAADFLSPTVIDYSTVTNSLPIGYGFA